MTETNLIDINEIKPHQIAGICDHTFLDRTEAFKVRAKQEENPIDSRQRAFFSFLENTPTIGARVPYAVCVRPEDVRIAKNYFAHRGGKVKVASVVGFPDGANYSTEAKVSETRLALLHGAREIDMVLNYKLLREKTYCEHVLREVMTVTQTAHSKGALVKVILEISELDNDQIIRACDIANRAQADFVKTSTGFSSGGATLEALEIMRAVFRGGIKISGGVTPDNVRGLLYAASGRNDAMIDLDPMMIRIGESSLLDKL